jgi:hypothetical protein
VTASAYIDPVLEPSGPPTAADIEIVSRKPADRLARDRVGMRLHADAANVGCWTISPASTPRSWLEVSYLRRP